MAQSEPMNRLLPAADSTVAATANVSKTGAMHQDSTAGSQEFAIVDWATPRNDPQDGSLVQVLEVALTQLPTAMARSRATGRSLVSNGMLGVDAIRLAAGDGFVPHTHPGDHVLIVVGGQGTITYAGHILPTRAGQVYLVDGGIPHAVGAVSDHVILAVGSPHRPVDATDRMAPTAYAAVTSTLGNIECHICELSATVPVRPHDYGCPHCPCENCVTEEA